MEKQYSISSGDLQVLSQTGTETLRFEATTEDKDMLVMMLSVSLNSELDKPTVVSRFKNAKLKISLEFDPEDKESEVTL